MITESAASRSSTADGTIPAQTAAMGAWLLGHLVLAAHMRMERQPLVRWNPFANAPYLLWVAGAVGLFLLGLAIPFLRERLHLTVLSSYDWAVILLSGFLLPSWWEIFKWVRIARSAGHAPPTA